MSAGAPGIAGRKVKPFASKSGTEPGRSTAAGNGGQGRASASPEIVLVDVNDLDSGIPGIEGNRIVRPVHLVEVDRALVVAVDQFARTCQGVDLAWVDRLADLLNHEPGIVPLDGIERIHTSPELGNLGPDLGLAGRVEAWGRGKLARNRVQNRDSVHLLLVDVLLQPLRLRGQN